MLTALIITTDKLTPVKEQVGSATAVFFFFAPISTVSGDQLSKNLKNIRIFKSIIIKYLTTIMGVG